MKLSPEGLKFLAAWEGEVLHTYLDSAGKPTIGVGHLIKPGEHYTTITHEQAMDLLASDVAIAEQAVNDLGVDLNKNQFDALVSFAFNVGVGALKSSTLAHDLKEGRTELAADEFLSWSHAGGKVNVGLLNRRKAERELFKRPVERVTGDLESYARLTTIAGKIDQGLEGLPP